jgi:hypothetical protein
LREGQGVVIEGEEEGKGLRRREGQGREGEEEGKGGRGGSRD